ncbi:SDR family NAD(P)-dependent oxidoreductase [Paracoccus homiensis]|uniref:SDR family NAD(P)-dependent oxidoreductase n=1 Tax=Paracoccus homiensis TaxID=364199 RepID=UPI00398CA4AC
MSSSGKGQALVAELGGFGVTGSNHSPGDLGRLVDGARGRWGRVDVLLNSAGHGPKGDMPDITDDQWHAGMEIYLLNVIRPTRLVTPIMAAQGDGAITNILTFAAFEPDPAFPTSSIFQILGYAATGFGWSSATCGRTGRSC